MPDDNSESKLTIVFLLGIGVAMVGWLILSILKSLITHLEETEW